MTTNQTINLGKLEKMSLGAVWPHEAMDFTPWLAKESNLRILGDTLGIELEPQDQEVAVGPFSADILCKNTLDSSWVIIENQIKKTNHEHLGQIITYAAGLNAKTQIWIAAHFTEEHRAALDWLNENTIEDISFFGLEIELWKIGNSEPAPKFNIISKPNDWSKTVKAQSSNKEGQITPHKQLQFEFWSEFKEYLAEKTGLRSQRPGHQHWILVTIGKSDCHLGGILSGWNSISESWEPEIRVELVLGGSSAKDRFAELQKSESDIQNKIDLPLTWHNLESSKSCKIYVRRDGDFTDRTKWPELFDWMATYVKKFECVFRPIIRELK